MKRRNIVLAALLLIGAVPELLFSDEKQPVPVQAKERDPMTPVEKSLFIEASPQRKAQKVGIQVQGIGRSPKGIYAIVDGKVLQEGQTKDGITLVKVHETKVDILINGIEESILLKKG